VAARARQGSPRARELIAAFGAKRKPWGVLAQVWPEDMELWRGHLRRREGTLWVVPHRVDEEHVQEIEAYLIEAGMRPVRTSNAMPAGDDRDCVLVDEVGVLLELYSAVEWAYVGGGFGISMHSTIEPALYGIPVSCGPNGERKFPEIAELTATGQLTIVRDSEELDRWLDGLDRDPEARLRWKAQAEGRLGATQAIVSELRGLVDGR
jgi:3-deoxy-D-manno-octulosonic-acid transferase